MIAATSTFSSSARLRDGRTLSYGEWGVPDGPLVFGFHGGGLSCLAHYGDDAPTRAGVRLVMPDRPGFGRSDAQPERTLLDWPRDVAELATSLGAERFAVFGASAGGPPALACGYQLPERVAAVGVTCGVGPYQDEPELAQYLPEGRRELVELARTDPEAARARIEIESRSHIEQVADDTEALVDEWPSGTPDCDRKVMADPELRLRFLAALRESAARGPDALTRETFLNYASPWGFDVSDLRVPVHIWHGRQDRIVPVEVAELLARRVEGATLHSFEGEGHSVDYLHIGEILATLAAAIDGQ